MTPKMVMAYGDMGDLAVLDLERSPTDLSKQGAAARSAAPRDDLLSPAAASPRRSTATSTPTAASTGPARPCT